MLDFGKRVILYYMVPSGTPAQPDAIGTAVGAFQIGIVAATSAAGANLDRQPAGSGATPHR